MAKISLLSVFYPFRGGIAQFSNALLKELKKNNNVLAVNFKRQYPNFLFPGKSQFVDEIQNFQKDETERIIDSINPISFLKAKNKINSFYSDILIVNYWMTFFGICKGFIAKKSKSKIKIALIHNLIPHEKKFYDNFVNRYFIKQFDAFIVMSETVKNDVLFYNSKAKILKLEHPNYNHFGEKLNQDIAISKLNEKGIPISKEKKKILFFGLIREYKGLDVLINAFSFLDESYQLIIAGECYGSFDSYQKIIDENKLNSKIILVNKFIIDDEVNLYFSAVDICALPYKSATQSGIVAVANHFIVPIISTNVGGLAESIQHNHTGIILNDFNCENFASKIEEFFTLKLIEKMKTNIEQKNKEQSWEFFASKVLDFAKNCKNH